MPYKNKEDLKAYREANKYKYKEYHKKYSAEYDRLPEQREQRRYRHVKRFYGLSVDEYKTLIIAQNNKCAICNKEESAKNKAGLIRPLCVDHDHVTGKVRQLLCNHCNSMLGHSLDNIEILEKAIEYIKRHKKV